MRLALDAQREQARCCSSGSRPTWARRPGGAILDTPPDRRAEIAAARRVARGCALALAVPAAAPAEAAPAGRWPATWSASSVWIVGGDGWAYDIGFGGLDHVLASGPQRQHPGARHRGLLQHRRPGVEGHAARRGGQVRRRRQGHRQEGPGHDRHGLRQRLRGPGGHGRQRLQTTKALLEADAWPGPSLVIAYSTCIAHGIDMSTSMSHQKDAVKSGYWPLYRFHPSEDRRRPAVQLDSRSRRSRSSDFVPPRPASPSCSAPTRAGRGAGRAGPGRRRRALALLRAAGRRRAHHAHRRPETSATARRTDDTDEGLRWST
jgi:pyruvate-ferredoxin/flavodoxin oxidoreductase